MEAGVGEHNCSFVLDFLRTEGIFVSAQDLLNAHPRKVYFFQTPVVFWSRSWRVRKTIP